MNKQIPNVSFTNDDFNGVIPLSFLGQEGMYDLSIFVERDSTNPTISDEQASSYHFFLENHEIIFSKIATLMLEEYPSIREELLDFQAVLPPIPVINTLEEMKENLELTRIHIHLNQKNGFAFVGIELECSWDIEHGLGFMTYKDTLLEYGDASVSFFEEYSEKFI